MVARTGRPTYPHSMLLRYAKLAEEDITSRDFVFRSLGFGKIKGHFLHPGTKLSYRPISEVTSRHVISRSGGQASVCFTLSFPIRELEKLYYSSLKR